MANQDTVTYGMADGEFFESPDHLQDEGIHFDLSHNNRPEGWNYDTSGIFVSLAPSSSRIPDQGWKIHVSSTPRYAEEILRIVWDYCIENEIAFKFLRSRRAVVVTNSKYWSRSASGKFITIYPLNNEQLVSTLTALDQVLSGYSGPYILSDIRYRDGPLFVRYGAFRPMWTLSDGSGARTLAIRHPDGHLIPDVRATTFSMPGFVHPPDILEPYIRNRSAPIKDCAYRFQTVLHFSNGGGVYLGTHKPSGTLVALKEARPFAGLDDREDDAVTRLRNEHSILQRLQDLDSVLKIVDMFELWEHQFLVTEFVEGVTLFDKILRTYPLVGLNRKSVELAAYRDWAQSTYLRLVEIVKDCHDRGVAVVDLHPSNVIVKPSGELILTDFECSTSLKDPDSASLGSPGFVAPASLNREDADWFALERVRLMMLIPLVPLLRLDPRKAQTFLKVACDSFGIDSQLRKNLRQGLEVASLSDSETDEAATVFASDTYDWTRIKSLLVASILNNATPDRPDRLFPGDTLQFSHGGATLAYGAAGVLLALKRVNQELPQDMVHWLFRASREHQNRRGLGLYDGAHGIAYVLRLAGADSWAEEVLEDAIEAALPTNLELFGGQSGIALNLLFFGRDLNRPDLISAAVEIGERIKDRIQSKQGSWIESTPGLMSGAAGIALLFIKLFEETAYEAYLDAAGVALRYDLRHGRVLDDGTYHLHIGSKYLPYFDGGSVGVGFVIDRFLYHRDDPELQVILNKIRLACQIPFVYQPGLFQGRAGLIALLADSQKESDRTYGYEQAHRLGWHACNRAGNLMFPGRGLARYSLDLATGTAGILITLQTLEDKGPLGLPFL